MDFEKLVVKVGIFLTPNQDGESDEETCEPWKPINGNLYHYPERKIRLDQYGVKNNQGYVEGLEGAVEDECRVESSMLLGHAADEPSCFLVPAIRRQS
jgi:hypothetical protein